MSRGGDLLRLQEIDTRLAHDRARLADVEALIAADPELESRRREARRLRREQVAADAELAALEKTVGRAEAARSRARQAPLRRVRPQPPGAARHAARPGLAAGAHRRAGRAAARAHGTSRVRRGSGPRGKCSHRRSRARARRPRRRAPRAGVPHCARRWRGRSATARSSAQQRRAPTWRCTNGSLAVCSRRSCTSSPTAAAGATFHSPTRRSAASVSRRISCSARRAIASWCHDQDGGRVHRRRVLGQPGRGRVGIPGRVARRLD